MAEDVELDFGANFDPAKRALAQFQSHMRSQMSIMGVAMGTIIGNVGFAAISGGINVATSAFSSLIDKSKEWVAAAAEAEQVDTRLEIAVRNAGNAFSYTADQLKESASLLQRQSTFGDEAIKQAQTMLLQFKLTGQTFRDTQQLALDMASALGQDLSSSAMRLGMAMADPTRGMLMLRRAGVTFTEQQREMVKAMMEAGDIAGAQGVILTELQKRYGGAAKEMSGTFSGALAQVTEVFGDLDEELGMILTPIMTELLPILRELGRAFVNMAAEARDSLFSTGEGAESMADVLRNTLLEIAAHIQSTVEHILDNIDLMVAKLEYWRSFAAAMVPGRSWIPFYGAPMSQAEKDWFNASENLEGAESRSRPSYDERFNSNLEGLKAALEEANKLTGDGLDSMTIGSQIAGMQDSVVNGIKNAMPDLSKDIAETVAQISDQTIAKMAAGVQDSMKETSGFASGFEDAMSTFRRIQSSVASTDEIPKRQLTELEKLVVAENDKRRAYAEQTNALWQLVNLAEKGFGAVAQ